MESVQDVSVTSNELQWQPPATSSFGMFLQSTIHQADGVLIQGNRINGFLSAAILLTAREHQPFRSVSVVGNMARGPAIGLRCAQSVAGLFHKPIVHASNAWSSPNDVP